MLKKFIKSVKFHFMKYMLNFKFEQHTIFNFFDF